MKLTKEQQQAIDILNSGRNVFLTGEAGTGKSTIINQFVGRTTKRNILTFAPTGIAALQVGGVTIHRGFKIERGVLPPTKFLFVPQEIEVADVIIIDEISMCRVDMFDRVVEIIMKANETRRRFKQDPIQLVLVGDFFQLPPVTTDVEKQALKHLYPNLKEYFAFNSKYWKQLDFQNIVLKEIMRQDDDNFIHALNDIRKGKRQAIDFLNNNASHKESDSAVTLTGINKVATQINQDKLKELSSLPVRVRTKIKGKVNPSDLCVDEELLLKEGARIMTIVNGSGYQNGTLGYIVKIDQKKKQLKVLLDNGEYALIKKNTWEVYGYSTITRSDGEKMVVRETIGTYEQFPVKLAYAITIHKSQGQTFSEMNLYPYSWDHGQLYVALSRVSSLKGLHLMESIKYNFLKTSNEVVDFYSKLK